MLNTKERTQPRCCNDAAAAVAAAASAAVAAAGRGSVLNLGPARPGPGWLGSARLAPAGR